MIQEMGKVLPFKKVNATSRGAINKLTDKQKEDLLICAGVVGAVGVTLLLVKMVTSIMKWLFLP